MKLTNQEVFKTAVKCQRSYEKYSKRYSIPFEVYFKTALKRLSNEKFVHEELKMTNYSFNQFKKIKLASKTSNVNLKELDYSGLVKLSQLTNLPEWKVLKILAKRGFDYDTRFIHVMPKSCIKKLPKCSDLDVYMTSNRFIEYKKMFHEKKVAKLEVALVTYYVKSMRGLLRDSIKNSSFYNEENPILKTLVELYNKNGKWATQKEIASLLNVSCDTYISRLAHNFLKLK